MPKVMIHPATYANIRPAVDRVFEQFPLDLKGKKVLVKPNVLRMSRAEEGIATHPAVLHAVVEKIETMQPESIVVGDNPGATSYGSNEKSFEQTGRSQIGNTAYLQDKPVYLQSEMVCLKCCIKSP